MSRGADQSVPFAGAPEQTLNDTAASERAAPHAPSGGSAPAGVDAHEVAGRGYGHSEQRTACVQRPLIAEHQLVLRALRVANMAEGRVVTSAEVTAAMSEGERSTLATAYTSGDLALIVPKVLDLLRARGVAYSPGRVGARRYYAASDVIPAAAARLPDTSSRRQQTLALARAAVRSLGRAVRACDVVEYASRCARDSSTERGRAPGGGVQSGTNRTLILRDLHNLSRTGELVVVDTVRGGEADGVNLYLPRDLEPERERYSRRAPMSWLELVAEAFDAVWTQGAQAAQDGGRRPRPVTTGAVRAHLAAKGVVEEKLRDPQVLVNAMQALASGEVPHIRRAVGREGVHALHWAPVAVDDEALDLGGTYASDSERVAEAARRACRSHAVPAVSRRAIQSEVDFDSALRPAGRQSVALLLADTAKDTLDWGDGTRQRRVRPLLYTLGRVEGEAYYAAPAADADADARETTLAAGQAHVRLLRAEAEWRRDEVLDRLRMVKTLTVPSIAHGRVQLALADASRTARELAAVLQMPHLAGATRADALRLEAETQAAMKELRAWVASHCTAHAACESAPPVDGVEAGADGADSVDTGVPGWTAEELYAAYVGLYPGADRISDPTKLVPLLAKAVRRVPNPEFVSRRTGAEFLFDRADALLYAAKEWGGRECVLHAGLAEHELERLRDVRYVYPALEDPSHDVRLAAVACLAFLWSDEARRRLKKTALGDADPGVRQSALWAYGFVGGDGAVDLCRVQSVSDPSRDVRAFGVSIIAAAGDPLVWWRV